MFEIFCWRGVRWIAKFCWSFNFFYRFWQVVCFLAFIAWISIDENLKNVLAQSIEKNPSIEKPPTGKKKRKRKKKKRKKKKEKEIHEINQKIFKKTASIFCSNLSHSKGRKKNFFFLFPILNHIYSSQDLQWSPSDFPHTPIFFLRPHKSLAERKSLNPFCHTYLQQRPIHFWDVQLAASRLFSHVHLRD